MISPRQQFTRLQMRSKRRPIPLGGENTYRRWYYLGFGLIIAGIPLHQPLLVVCGILLVLVLATVDIWAHYCLDALRYQRQLSEQRVSFGEEIRLSMSVENAKLLPLPWLEVADVVPRALPVEGGVLHGGSHGNLSVLESLFSPRWYERITRRYIVHCTTRGVHTFGPTDLRSGDVFGFVKREMRIEDPQYVLVYPLVAPLTSFNIPARHPFGDRRAPRRLLEDPSRVIGIRDYVYGDSMRRVNWKASARAMQLQSKVYEATTTYTLVLFLNIVSSLDVYYGVHPELHELSISAAASVSQWAIDQGYAVGLYANTIMYMPDMQSEQSDLAETNGATLDNALAAQLKRRRIHVPASSNAEQLTRILEVLARIQTYFGTNIEDVMQAERTRLPAGATVVIITSAVSEVLIDTLTRIRQEGHAVAILFVGDAPPPLKLAGITIYHLGGEEAWRLLVSTHGNTQDAAAQGFNL